MSLVNFQERLKNARNEKGMTQRTLAAKLGVTEQAVSKWERGGSYPDVEMLDQIASVLDCSLDYLFQHEQGHQNFLNQESLEKKRELDRCISKEIIGLRFGMGLVDLFMEEQKKGFPQIFALRREAALKWGIYLPIIRIADEMECSEQECRIELYGRTVQSIPDCDPSSPDSVQGIWTGLRECVFAHLDRIINNQTICDMVSNVRERYPAIVEGFVPERCSYSMLRQVVLEMLWKRHCAVDNLPLILQLLEERWEEAPDVGKLVDSVVTELGEEYQISL